ncbi:hypothetical protein BJ165DRAFT_1513929 [Panaeolus papilionaceus]|nr:hypothetical protein BJ165DRAFT_1513929 [Panaeolus papilionaceus]
MSSPAFTVRALTGPFLDDIPGASISISCPLPRRPRAASTPARLDNGVDRNPHTPTSNRDSTGAWNEVMAEFPAPPQAGTANSRASDLRVMSLSAEGRSHVAVPIRLDTCSVPIPRPLPSINRNAACSPLLRSAQRPLLPTVPLSPRVDAHGHGDPPLYSGLSTHLFFSTAKNHTLSDPFQACGPQYHNSQYSTGSSFSSITPPPQYSSRASSLHPDASGIGNDEASHIFQGMRMESAAREVFMRSQEGLLRSRDGYLAGIGGNTPAPSYTSLNESETP